MQKLLQVSWETLFFSTPDFTSPDKIFEKRLWNAPGEDEEQGQCCSFHVDVGGMTRSQVTRGIGQVTHGHLT